MIEPNPPALDDANALHVELDWAMRKLMAQIDQAETALDSGDVLPSGFVDRVQEIADELLFALQVWRPL